MKIQKKNSVSNIMSEIIIGDMPKTVIGDMAEMNGF